MTNKRYFNNPNPRVNVLAKKQADKIIDSTYKALMPLIMLYLNDKHDFTADELFEMFKTSEKWIEEICEGRISIRDINKTLYEETGIEIEIR